MSTSKDFEWYYTEPGKLYGWWAYQMYDVCNYRYRRMVAVLK
jgi:hypothetical protein